MFHVHVKALCLALGKANSAEAARRKFAIKTLWVLCGRGGEPALLAYESMRWNALLNCVSGEADQSKTSKSKYFCFIAGVDHLSDWAIDFGDALVWEKGYRKFNADKKTWLFPDLYAAKSSTTTITDYMKAMQAPGLPGSLQKFQDYAITHDKYGVELPPAPTAKGMRHGACETICIGVPAELAIHVTGHDLTSVGALFNYLNARVAPQQLSLTSPLPRQVPYAGTWVASQGGTKRRTGWPLLSSWTAWTTRATCPCYLTGRAARRSARVSSLPSKRWRIATRWLC